MGRSQELQRQEQGVTIPHVGGENDTWACPMGKETIPPLDDRWHVRSPDFSVFSCAVLSEKGDSGDDSWVVTFWEMNREEVYRDRG